MPPSKIPIIGIGYFLLNLGKRPPKITDRCQGQPDGKSLSLKRQLPSSNLEKPSWCPTRSFTPND